MFNEDIDVGLTDIQILKDLIDSEKLTDSEEAAFTEMLKGLDSRRIRKLTDRQRQWLEEVHEKLGLDPGSANMVSSGRIRISEEERRDLNTFLKTLGPKILRPPGRK